MSFEREKALYLGKALLNFYQYVCHQYKNKKISFDRDKLFRLKCLVEEFQFELLGKEILRINGIMWM